MCMPTRKRTGKVYRRITKKRRQQIVKRARAVLKRRRAVVRRRYSGYIPVPLAADRLGVPRSTLYRWTKRGLPAKRVSGLVLVNPAQIKPYLVPVTVVRRK